MDIHVYINMKNQWSVRLSESNKALKLFKNDKSKAITFAINECKKRKLRIVVHKLNGEVDFIIQSEKLNV